MKITELNYHVESEGRTNEEILEIMQWAIEEGIRGREGITKDHIRLRTAPSNKLRGELIETAIVVQLVIPVALEIWRQIILPKLKRKLKVEEEKKRTKSC